MWARKDNGSNVTWPQATDYCQNLSLGGYSGWHLPTIDQLDAIYDESHDNHNKGGIFITGDGASRDASREAWSITPGNASDETWVFDFSIGNRYSFRSVYNYHLHALCVRG